MSSFQTGTAAAEPAPRGDQFPATMHTLIQGKLDAGQFEELNHHIMSAYYEPLQIYLRGSSARKLGDAADLVTGFFITRLQRSEYLARWKPKNQRFRSYLINGLWFYLKEELQRRQRDRRHVDLPDELPDLADGPEQFFHQASTVNLVQLALAQVQELCETKGQGQHFQIFVRHFFEGLSFPELAMEYGGTASQVEVKHRTPRRHFKKHIRQLITRELADEKHIDEEIQNLLSTIKP